MQLVSIEVAPVYTVYPGVLKYYRAEGISVSQALWSLWYWHTETINAWTMIINWFTTVGLGYWMAEDLGWLIPTICSTVVVCHMIASIGYHLFMPISESTAVFWRKLDVTMILVFGVVWTVTLNYYVFNSLMVSGLGLMATAVAAKKIHRLWWKCGSTHDQQPEYIDLVVDYSFLIGMYLTGMVYMAVWEADRIAQMYLAGSVGCLGVGGSLVVYGLPERLFPGKFDLIGNSHQLMHLFIVNTGRIIEMCFIWYAYVQRHKPSSQL